MNRKNQNDAQIDLDCALELRIQGDYCRGLVRVKEDGRVLFDEYIATRGLIASLLGDTQEPVMTCSCTVPECAGFYEQESHLGNDCIEWTMRYDGEDLSLIFDRNAYEAAALTALRHFYNNPWNTPDFGTVPDEYKEFDDFVELVGDMLAAFPRLVNKWQCGVST